MRIINAEDRSLERVRYVEIAVMVESKGIRGRGVIAKEDRVLASVRVIYDSVRAAALYWE